MTFDDSNGANPFWIDLCAILRCLPVVDDLSGFQWDVLSLSVVVLSRFGLPLGRLDAHSVMHELDTSLHLLHVLANRLVT